MHTALESAMRRVTTAGWHVEDTGDDDFGSSTFLVEIPRHEGEFTDMLAAIDADDDEVRALTDNRGWFLVIVRSTGVIVVIPCKDQNVARSIFTAVEEDYNFWLWQTGWGL